MSWQKFKKRPFLRFVFLHKNVTLQCLRYQFWHLAVLKIPYPSKDLHESLGNKLHLISQKMRLFEANLKKIKNKDRSFARTFAADLKAHVVTTLCHFNYTAKVKACRVNILTWKAKKRRSLCENRGKEDNGVDKSVNTANNDENKDVNVDNAVKNMI